MMPSRGRFIACIIASLAFILPSAALQANLAGLVDWHKPLIGRPLSSPTPPSFVDASSGPRILTLTERNVFAALHVCNGSIAWRHILEPSDPVVSYHVHEDSVLLLSGPSGSTARLFDLAAGHMLWEQALLPDPALAMLTVPVWLGTDVAFAPHDSGRAGGGAGGSVVILSAGRRVNKIWLKTGETAWSFEAPGVGDTIVYKQLLVAGPNLHVLAVTSSFASPQLSTSTFSLETSIPLGDLTQIPSIASNPEDAHLVATGPAASNGAARIIWLEAGRVRSTYLSEKGQVGATTDLLPAKGLGKMLPSGENKFARTLGPTRESRKHGFILVERTGGTVDVIDVRKGAEIAATLSKLDVGVHTAYSLTESSEGLRLGRTYWSAGLNMGIHNSVLVHDGGEKSEQSFTFPLDAQSDGLISQAIAGPIVPAQQSPQILVITSNSNMQLVTEDKTGQYAKWTRDEELADIAFVRFVDLGEPEIEEARHLLADENFAGRLFRHDVPSFVFHFVTRLLSTSYTSTVQVQPLSAGRLHRDQFGFQKLLVAITTHGKLYAMDSASGNAIWTRMLSTSTEADQALEVVGLWRVREFGEQGNPLLSVVATRGTGETAETLAWTIDGFTGHITANGGQPKIVFSGSTKAAFLIPYENCSTKQQVLAIVSELTGDLQIYPYCKKMAGEVAKAASTIFFSTTERSLTATALNGQSIEPKADQGLTTKATWSIPFPVSEQIISIEAAGYSKVAAFGRVTGDKSTLYKYLNPHLSVISTLSGSAGQGWVYVLDTASGHIVWSGAVETYQPIKAVMSENWLVYSWLSSSGWRLASVELYENRNVSKAETPGLSSFAGGHDVSAISQTFISPTGIEQLAFTDSKFGITTKDLVLVDSNGRVASLPRRLLDPRRPLGKPTKADQEEMLYPYDPLLPLSPRQVISHHYDVAGVRHLASSASLLESTSLLFAYGLDLFLTRGLNPSGTFDILTDNFNKAQLLLTLGGLSVGIFLAQPAVRRKQLKAKWY